MRSDINNSAVRFHRQQSNSVHDSANLSNQQPRQSSSSGNNVSAFFERSSSMGRGMLPSLPADNPSQDYSRMYVTNDRGPGNSGFLSTIPCVEVKKSSAGDLDLGDFWKTDNFQSINLIDHSKMIPDEEQMRLSFSLGTSMLLRRKNSSNLYNKMSFLEEEERE